MANLVETCIIVLVYNEAENLQKLLGQIHALQLANAEIIVVDDGRSDGSAAIAMAVGANVVRHPYKIGNGAAVKSGMRAVKGPLILLINGDGRTSARIFPDCWLPWEYSHVSWRGRQGIAAAHAPQFGQHGGLSPNHRSRATL